MKYALKNCSIVVGNENGDTLENKTILIHGDRIEKIIDSQDSISQEYKVIDLSNKFVMPGLINLHVHLFGSGKPMKALGGKGGFAQKTIISLASTHLGKKILDSAVKEHALTNLYSGVTTIRGVGDFLYSDVRVRNEINSGKYIGPRLIVSGPAITTSNGHGAGTFAVFSDEEEGLKELVRKNKDEGVDFIKTCTTGGVMDAKKLGEPGEVKMTLSQTKAICDEAHRLGLKVASHVESTEGMRIALQAGVDTIEHGSIVDDEILKLFKEKHSSLTCTLSPALPTSILGKEETKLSDFARENTAILCERMINGVKVALNNNILVGCGTDASCPFVSQYNTYKELKYMVMKLGISSSRAINIATLNNAKVLGLEKEIGSIEENKIADLIVTNDNPINNLDTLNSLVMVMAKGEIVNLKKIKRVKVIDKDLEKLGL